MALVVVWEKAAVRMADGTEKILYRGEQLPDEVSDFQRSVMVSIGAARDLAQAVAQVQQAVDETLRGLEDPPPPPQYPAEVPPVRPVDPRLNTDRTAIVPESGAPTAVTEPGGPTVSNSAADVTDGSAAPTDPADGTVDPATVGSGVTKPKASEPKDAWEAYATDRGYMGRSEAESMTKSALVAEVNRREQV